MLLKSFKSDPNDCNQNRQLPGYTRASAGVLISDDLIIHHGSEDGQMPEVQFGRRFSLDGRGRRHYDIHLQVLRLQGPEGLGGVQEVDCRFMPFLSPNQIITGMSEIYELPKGKIAIAFCDESRSVGLLELEPKQDMPKHNRPVDEELVQIHGSCVVKLFEGGEPAREVELKECEKLIVPANQFHVHSNPAKERSITLWKFEGNVVGVIENIRNNFKKII